MKVRLQERMIQSNIESKQTATCPMNGNVEVVVKDMYGHVKQQSVIHNAVTSDGLRIIANAMAYTGNSPYITGIEVTYTVGNDPTVLSIVKEITMREVIMDTNPDNPTSTIRFNYYLPSNLPSDSQTVTLREAKLLFTDELGTVNTVFATTNLVDSTTSGSIEKDQYDVVSIIWNVVFQNVLGTV